MAKKENTVRITEQEDDGKTDFCFTEEGIVIRATSMEEAQEIYKEMHINQS